MNESSQFLPLDSGIVSQKCMTTEFSSGFNESQNQIVHLLNKIGELQKNYMCIEAKYQRKIKQLRLELNEKHKVQAILNTEMALLAKQYEDHKNQIQKISEQIKKSLQNQTNIKPKSKSPKNHINNSPNRLIKKSLQFDKRNQQKKQIIKTHNNLHDSQPINSKNSERVQSHTFEVSDKNKTLQDIVQKQKNKLNQSQTSKKTLQSPKNGITLNGPSPKKNILFNSSKQLDIFNPKNKPKKFNTNTIFTIGTSPSRKLNSSPMALKKRLSQKEANSNNVTNNQSISQQMQVCNNTAKTAQDTNQKQKKQTQKHQNHLISDNLQKNQVKKPSSPSNVGYLKKKVYSPQTSNNKKISSPLRPVRQLKISNKQIQVKKTIRVSPGENNKQIKLPKKVIDSSPTHKRIDIKNICGQTQKKSFGNLRQKMSIGFI